MSTVEALRKLLCTRVNAGGDLELVVSDYDAAEYLSMLVNSEGASGAIRGPEQWVQVQDEQVSELQAYFVSLAELQEGE